MSTPQLKIEGRSGCKITFIETPTGIRLRKFSSDEGYNNRLRLQEEKQLSFQCPEGFFTPAVLGNGTEGNLYWFDMDYISGDKYSTYFTKVSKQRIDEIIELFIQYFKTQIDQSVKVSPPLEAIHAKTESLIQTLHANAQQSEDFIHQLHQFLKRVPTHPLYQGECHGDFTLSNMLFLTSGRICAFDLLDSFINSPVIDWVKLKQDTIYKWSIHIENKTLNNDTKLIQVLDYINSHLDAYFKTDLVIQHWEKYLTVFNLARILPYAKDERDREFLNKHLTALI